MTDINDRIQRLTVWCLAISCLAQAGLALNVSEPRFCRPRASPTMPKRATVISRDYLMSTSHISGCLDRERLHNNPDQMAVVHLHQRKMVDRLGIRVRVVPPAEGFKGRLTLVLHSTFAVKWRLDLSQLITPGFTGRHLVVLTHREAACYSELTERYLDVLHIKPMRVSFDKRTRLAEDSWTRLLPHLRSQGLPSPSFVFAVSTVNQRPSNSLDLHLPSRPPTSGPPGCLNASLSALSALGDVCLDSVPVVGFDSCRSHLWEEDGKTRPLLQLVEFSYQLFSMNDFRMEVRLTVPDASQPGAAPRVAVGFFLARSKPFPLRLDARAIRRPVHVISNFPLSVEYPEYDGAAMVNVSVVEAESMEQLEEAVSAQLGPGLDTWSVERLVFNLPQLGLGQRYLYPTLVLLRLHEPPLLLRDVEPWIDFNCFETKDMVVAVPMRVFDALNVKQSQVLLGGDPRCAVYENKTQWWVWKVLVQGVNTCSTTSKDLGGQTEVKNWLSINSSTGLEVYRLYIDCHYRHDSGVDLPPDSRKFDGHFIWHLFTPAGAASTPQRSPVSEEDFALELFLDKEMKQPLSESKEMLKTNQRLYGRVQPTHMSVEPGLMVRDCFISGGRGEFYSKHRHYILHHGCEMGAYFVWNEADSYRLKSFSFELPRPSFFSPDSTFYLTCHIQPCNYFHPSTGLPRCWRQRFICQFPSMPASTQLVAGPYSSFPTTIRQREQEEGVRIPLWGAVLIAGIAFIFGVAGAGVLWLVHHLTRRRGRRSRRSQLSPDGGPASVLLRMNARHLEQERCRLLHAGVARPDILWGQEYRGQL